MVNKATMIQSLNHSTLTHIYISLKIPSTKKEGRHFKLNNELYYNIYKKVTCNFVIKTYLLSAPYQLLVFENSWEIGVSRSTC